MALLYAGRQGLTQASNVASLQLLGDEEGFLITPLSAQADGLCTSKVGHPLVRAHPERVPLLISTLSHLICGVAIQLGGHSVAGELIVGPRQEV